MKIVFDFFPIVVFFAAYKLFGIFTATATAMVLSLLQVLFFRLKYRRYEKIHVISLLIVMVLGSATLLLHDPVFIKWKPTGLYWLSAIAFAGSGWFAKKPLIQKIMESNIELPAHVWYRLNTAWSLFFVLMGALNIVVAYLYSLDAWVNFKLFGGAGLTLLFVFLQALYMTQHSEQKTLDAPPSRDQS